MLVYDDHDPRARTAGARQKDRGEGGGLGPSVRSVMALLRRRALMIVGFALLGTLLAFAVGKVVTPRYTAQAQLYIDPRDLRLLDKELTTAGQDSTGYLTIVESQAQVITSSNVLGRVVESLNLTHDPEFGGAGAGPGLLGRLGFPQTAASPDADAEFGAALDALAKRVTVRRTGKTFIVDIEATSRDADKAARIANAVVDSYLAEEAANRAESANRASAGLSSRLVELREDLNRAESKVQSYKAEHGLVGTRDSLVTDQQLTQLNSQLAAARVRAADAQARFDGVQRIQAAGLDAGATEDALASQSIIALRNQFAELSRKQAELSHDLGPRHPMVSSINSQVQLSRRLIDQEITRVIQAARADLARAQATVASLEKSFDGAKGRTVGMAQAAIRMRELEREADASRAVYEAFLVRARETSQQARLDAGNARVITQAVKPISRSYPPPARTLAMLGLVAGLLIGIAFAVAEQWLKGEMRASAETGSGSLEAIEAVRRRRTGSVTIVGSDRVPAAVGGLL